jgi:hypothetical protein
MTGIPVMAPSFSRAAPVVSSGVCVDGSKRVAPPVAAAFSRSNDCTDESQACRTLRPASRRDAEPLRSSKDLAGATTRLYGSMEARKRRLGTGERVRRLRQRSLSWVLRHARFRGFGALSQTGFRASVPARARGGGAPPPSAQLGWRETSRAFRIRTLRRLPTNVVRVAEGWALRGLRQASGCRPPCVLRSSGRSGRSRSQSGGFRSG